MRFQRLEFYVHTHSNHRGSNNRETTERVLGLGQGVACLFGGSAPTPDRPLPQRRERAQRLNPWRKDGRQADRSRCLSSRFGIARGELSPPTPQDRTQDGNRARFCQRRLSSHSVRAPPRGCVAMTKSQGSFVWWKPRNTITRSSVPANDLRSAG